MCLFIYDVAVAKLFTTAEVDLHVVHIDLDLDLARSRRRNIFIWVLHGPFHRDGNAQQPLMRACPPMTTWIQPLLLHLPIYNQFFIEIDLFWSDGWFRGWAVQ